MQYDEALIAEVIMNYFTKSFVKVRTPGSPTYEVTIEVNGEDRVFRAYDPTVAAHQALCALEERQC